MPVNFFFPIKKMKRIAAWVLGFAIGGGLLHLVGFLWERSLAPAASSNLPTAEQNAPADDRFVVLSDWNSEAVLDRKTGLVWERSPNVSFTNWSGAQNRCENLLLGKHKGWRLPTIFELATLVDPNVPSPGPTLPAGHPFTVASSFYWSATTDITNNANAWGVGFNIGDVGSGVKSAIDYVWCVRDGEGLQMTPL
jgi:hypothetical protein